jgi:hypothetical protein
MPLLWVSRFRGRLASSGLVLILKQSFTHLVRFPEREFNSLQVLCMHRTMKHRKPRTFIHAQIGIRNNDPTVRAVQDSTCIRSLLHWCSPLHFRLEKRKAEHHLLLQTRAMKQQYWLCNDNNCLPNVSKWGQEQSHCSCILRNLRPGKVAYRRWTV